ncbi:MAG TPA: hypothetical protein DCW33_03150 [Proteobacteria bacterium]|nr:hypothetical protein [Pseudomonadota bacterium]
MLTSAQSSLKQTTIPRPNGHKSILLNRITIQLEKFVLARQAAILVHMYGLGKHHSIRPSAQSSVDHMKFALLIGSYGQ